jgi:hypothetical protein
LVFADHACGELVLVVSSAVSDARMDFCHLTAGFLAVLGAFLLLGKTTPTRYATRLYNQDG